MSTSTTDVQVPIRTIGEAERKSQNLLDALRQLLGTLNAPPELPDVKKLHQLTTELLTVATMIDDLRGETQQAQAVIGKWRSDNSENIQALAPLLSKPLSQIDSLIEGNQVKPDALTCLLNTCSDLISHAIKVSELQQKIKTATDALDHAKLLLLIEALGSTTIQRTQTLTQIESELQRIAGESTEGSRATDRDPGQSNASEQNGSENLTADHTDTTQSSTRTNDAKPAIAKPSDLSHGTTLEDDKAAESTGPVGKTTEHSADHLRRRYKTTIAESLANGRFGIAYHLTSYTPDNLLNSNAIKLIAMNYANDDNGSVTAELSNLAASLFGHTRDILKRANLGATERDSAVVLATAAFKPAIQAPGGPVAQFLSSLRTLLTHLPTLQSLTSQIADISLQGAEIPLGLLKRPRPTDDWNTRKIAMQKKIDKWIKAERQSRLLFGRATKVWHKLLSAQTTGDKASIGCICDQINNNQPTPELLDRVKVTVEDLKQHKDKEIDRIDRSLRPISSTRKIEGAARIQLRKKIDEAVALISEWNTLITSQSTKAISHQVEQRNRLLKAVEEHRLLATQEIATLDSPFAKCASDLLAHYLGLFESAEQDTPIESTVPLELLLHGDLLLDPQIEFSDTVEVLSPPSVPQLLDLASMNPESEFHTAATERANRGDFYGSPAPARARIIQRETRHPCIMGSAQGSGSQAPRIQ